MITSWGAPSEGWPSFDENGKRIRSDAEEAQPRRSELLAAEQSAHIEIISGERPSFADFCDMQAGAEHPACAGGGSAGPHGGQCLVRTLPGLPGSTIDGRPTMKVDVRIRHEDDSDAVFLCRWPLDDIDNLIPTISRWGVLAHGDVSMGLCGQFVIPAIGDAYFEMIVG